MKHMLTLIALLNMLFLGCDEENNLITTQVDDVVFFEINYLQYSDNNYFLDKVYADTNKYNIYNLYYGSSTPIILPKYVIKNIEVYKSISNVSETIESIIAHAYIDLPSRSSSEMYSDSLRNNNIITPGKNEASRFKLLSKNADYIIHNETGYITFLIPIYNHDVIAVAYRIENDTPSDSDDLYYGEFISELVNNSKTTGVLKLIKPMNLQAIFKEAWKLKMKNIYQVTPTIEQISNLDLDIYIKKSDETESDKIDDIKLLELFGFDNINEKGVVGSDGKFDDIPGINYEPRTGEVIFPVIQPFGKNIPTALENYRYQAIYDTIKNILSSPNNSFIIKGKYKLK